ncbi:MAG: UDP-glucose/GDP-mannose dehydrogenase family protein [Cyanobacteria bacterium P01_H01_bin.74]
MKITIIGSGYVGTVTGTCLAELGHQVICADAKVSHIAGLQKGEVSFFEEALSPMIRGNLEEGRLAFTTDIVSAVKSSAVIFLCIGTPILPTGKPDFSALTMAVKDIAAGMDGYRLIIEKSTLPIKTGTWLSSLLCEHVTGEVDFDIAAVPQFLREGHAVQDFMHPDRIIIGADSKKALDTIMEIYQPLNAPILVTDVNSAELIKHATNAFLATKISFINSIAQICEKTGADINAVSRGLGLDHRIDSSYLNAGIGYGGIFFPKDINSLLNIADEYHINLDLLKQVDHINRYQRISFIEKLDAALDNHLEGKTIAIWGISYRPKTNDLRDIPSFTIIRGLENRGANIRVYDPLSMAKAKEQLPKLTYCDSAYDAAKGADAIAILTEWDEFAYINFTKLRQESDCRLIVDGRNLYSLKRMTNLGYTYVSIGRQTVTPQMQSPITGL